jgi:hypothetical protein
VVGPAINIRVPGETLARLDEFADLHGTSRASTIRELIDAALETAMAPQHRSLRPTAIDITPATYDHHLRQMQERAEDARDLARSITQSVPALRAAHQATAAVDRPLAVDAIAAHIAAAAEALEQVSIHLDVALGNLAPDQED